MVSGSAGAAAAISANANAMPSCPTKTSQPGQLSSLPAGMNLQLCGNDIIGKIDLNKVAQSRNPGASAIDLGSIRLRPNPAPKLP
jgi:hypothetical protein